MTNREQGARADGSARVTLLSLNFAPEPTGIGPYATKLALGLEARGHDVTVLTAFPHYPQWRIADGYSGLTIREQVDDVAVTRLRHFVPRQPQGIARAMSEMSFGLRLLTSRWGDPDVVLCMSPALISTSLAVARARSGRRRPAVGVIVQDLYSAGVVETAGAGKSAARGLARLERRTLSTADGVVAIHDRLKARLVRDFALDPAHVTVIRNWTHVASPPAFDRDRARESLGWRSDETVVLHTGAMGEKQGLSNVVDAARLADQRSSPVRFVLMGHGGQWSQLEQASSGVTRLDMLPPVADADYATVLASADVLLVNELARVHEMAVPSKLTSYFSTGRPVLAATDAESTTAHEVATSGAGLRVDPGDPGMLLDAAMKLASDPSLSNRLGERGRAFCKDTLSADTALTAYDAWVRRLVATTMERSRT